ncbi:DUF2334 domain-containing protein [Halobaculum sp. WSA2]|uniref:DUF2334 domain-containing protein n=1 Tax=Halobaculum saliterrae TaxID=2073113 RepID=A0A6B0SZS9_9EURY|nr:DUF2334 domain-containing protein [Halobaculum saliterrae]MXR41852.1 DUF2334 domain-containing protein [Halobaculum saliterrae]
MSKPGVFIVSLDTELAWGRFDMIDVETERSAFENTPAVIEDLVRLFDRHEISATWALVAHLLRDCEGSHEEPEPAFEWIDWMSALPCRSKVSRDLWYAPEILETIRNATVDHDIGLHGYTHMILGANGCFDDVAAAEIDTALDIAAAEGIDPDSFIYPRNEIGHQKLLADRGFEVYRGLDQRWFEHENVPKVVKPGIRFLEELTQLTPPTVTPSKRRGLVKIPGSQVFRPYHNGWQYTPCHSQRTRAKKGLRRAAETGEIFHLWFHPCNLASDRDMLLAELDAILGTAAELRDEGELEVMSMSDVATAYREGRWQRGDNR